ncbi:hypothetical protein ACLB2K_012745 [Fragaria x ananassa]
MASQFCLLGPSELRRPNLPKANQTLMTTSGLQDPSLSYLKPLLLFIFDEKEAGKPPLFAEKEIYKYYLHDMGKEAWKVGPLQTLKLIFSLRAAGRLDDGDFYRTIWWVNKNHPLTLALNLRVFGDLGLFKDLLGILDMVLEESIFEHYVWTPYGHWCSPQGNCFSFLEGYQCLEKEENLKLKKELFIPKNLAYSDMV